MINKETLNKYISNPTKQEDKDKLAEEILLDAYEMLNSIQNEIEALAEDKTFIEDVKENGIPEDLGAAILQIKENAGRGDSRAVDTIEKIQKDLLSIMDK